MSDASATIDRLVARAGQLYSLPAVVIEVLELTSRPELDTHSLRECIENDPALTTKILRVVNSSLFGLSREVLDLTQALTLLGTKPLKLLVLGFSLPEGLFAGVRADLLGRYWRHTLTKAVAAREIAETLWHQPGDDAFIAALLQDLGMLLLFQEVGEPYFEFLARVDATGQDLVVLEKEAMGFDHTALTARLLRQWGLPQTLVNNIAWEDVQLAVQDSSPSASALPKIIHLAELMTQLLAGDRPGLLGDLLAVGDRYRSLSPSQLEALVADLEDKVAQLASVLRLELPEGQNFHEVLVQAHLQLAQVAAEAAGDLIEQRLPARQPQQDERQWTDEMRSLSEAVARVSRQAARSSKSPPVTKSSPSPPATPNPAPVATAIRSRPAIDDEPDPGLIGQLVAAVAACRRSRCALSLLLAELGDVEQLVGILGVGGLEAARRLLETACRDLTDDCPICVPHGDAGFAVILSNCDRQLAARLGNELVSGIARHVSRPLMAAVQGLQIGVGASTVSLPPKNFAPAKLLEAATRCLNSSHHSGGNVVKSIEIY